MATKKGTTVLSTVERYPDTYICICDIMSKDLQCKRVQRNTFLCFMMQLDAISMDLTTWA